MTMVQSYPSLVAICLLLVIPDIKVSCQIQGLFSQLYGSRDSLDKGCGSRSVSCLPAPWCQRGKDENGCVTCSCGGRTSMSGKEMPKNRISRFSTKRAAMNPFSSMFGNGGSFGFPGYPSFNGQMGQVNPMAAMFGGASFGGSGNGRPMSGPMGMSGMGGMGGMSGMGGFGGMGGLMGGQNTATASPDCDPSPYTCPAPPPWCQRTVDGKGCVKCYCGEDLEKYLSKLQGKHETTTPDNNSTLLNSTTDATTDLPTSILPITTTATTTTTMAPPLGKPCLANFLCTLDCVTGFQTDQNNCPLCACNGDATHQSPVVTPRNKVPLRTSSSTMASVIMCPGIFDCMKQCMNGFEVDAQGCPLCKCVPDT